MEKPDGGAAFPVLEEYAQFNDDLGRYEDHYAPQGGMTLRDYFAAKAMQALIGRGTFDGDRAALASHAYGVADFMLAERSK